MGAASPTVVYNLEVTMRVTPSIAAVPLLLAACQPATTSLSDAQSNAIADTAVSRVVAKLINAVAERDVELGLRGLNSRLIWAEDDWYTADRDSVTAAIEGLFGSMRESKLEWGTLRTEVHGPDTAMVATTFRWHVIDTLGVTNFVDGACNVAVARTEDGWQIVPLYASRIPQSRSR